MNRRRLCGAFTLIELLVVIGILAILAAILFPVFLRAKEAAKASSCASNIRNLALAVELYQIDHDGRFPLAAYADGPGFLLWHDMTDPYLNNKQVWHCPSSDVSKTDASGAITSHYGYNALYLTTIALDFSNAQRHTAFQTSDIANPSETVLFIESKSSVPNSWCGDDGKFLLPPSQPDTHCWGRPHPVHMERTNVAFVDMHVKRLSPKAYYEGRTPPDEFFDRQ
jgi:prepilin-type N-terminal cleavage/methylation domain-containing protein